MTIDLRIATEIRNSGRRDNAITINVSVNDVRVMTLQQTKDSIGIEPKFTAIAEFGPEEWRIFTPSYDWQTEFLEGEKIARLEIPFGMLPAAISNAVEKMFHGASRLEIEQTPTGYDVTMDGRYVMNWLQMEHGEPFECVTDQFDQTEAGEDEDMTWSLLEHDERFEFSARGDDCPNVWDEQYIEDITPHAHRALRERWVRN